MMPFGLKNAHVFFQRVMDQVLKGVDFLKCYIDDVSQPHFEASVRMRLALPKVGTWSPLGLLQLHSSITKVKTPLLEVFVIPLKRP